MPVPFPFAVAFLPVASLSVFRRGSAQTLRFKHYSTDEDFTGARYKKIVQDSFGFLPDQDSSLLTDIISYDTEAVQGLPQDDLGRIWIDPYGRLWSAAPGRLLLYDRDTNGFVFSRNGIFFMNHLN